MMNRLIVTCPVLILLIVSLDLSGTINVHNKNNDAETSPSEQLDCPKPWCSCTRFSDGVHVQCNEKILMINQEILNETSQLTVINVGQEDLATNLKAILDQAENLRKFTIHYSYMKGLLTNGVFSNIHKLEEFDMCHNGRITHIDSNFFYNMTNLRKIRFATITALKIPTLQKAFESIRSNKVDTIVVDFVGPGSLTTLDEHFFYPFRKSPLKNVVLANLGITYAGPGITKYIKSTSCLKITGSYRGGTKKEASRLLLDILSLHELRVVDGSGLYTRRPNTYGSLSDICIEPLSNTTEIHELDESTINETQQLYSRCKIVFSIPLNIRYIFAHDLLEVGKSTDIPFCVDYNNNVRYIDIRNTYVGFRFGLYGLLRLQYANIQNTAVDKLRLQTFSHIPSIITFLVGENPRLGTSFDTGNATYALTKLTNLSSIDFASCEISTVSKLDFTTLTNVKFVNLSGNRLLAETLNHSVNFNFTYLNLSNNQLTYLPVNFRRSLNKIIRTFRNKTGNRTTNLAIDLSLYPLPVVDASGNPFVCTCDSLQFIKWFKMTAKHFYNAANYSCELNSTQYPLLTFDLSLIKNCDVHKHTTTYTAQIIGGTIAAVLILLLSFVSYRYKTHVKYYLYFLPYVKLSVLRYALHIHPYRSLPEESSDENDVFILCSGHDRQVVLEHIKPGLRRHELTVIVGEEDFPPGRSIPEEIVRAMSTSMCALLLLSTKFIRSPWLNYEVSMAIAMKKKLIVVRLDNLPHRLMPPALMYLYNRRQTHLRYPTNPDRLPAFLASLSQAIKGMRTSRL